MVGPKDRGKSSRTTLEIGFEREASERWPKTRCAKARERGGVENGKCACGEEMVGTKETEEGRRLRGKPERRRAPRSERGEG